MEAEYDSRSASCDFANRVRKALDELLPAMIADGGGAEFVSLENGVATLRLVGSCNFCPSRKLSAAALQRGILQRVPEVGAVNILYPVLPNPCNQLAPLIRSVTIA